MMKDMKLEKMNNVVKTNMTNDMMKKDMILHTRNEEQCALGRTQVRLKAYCSAPWGVLHVFLLLLMMTVGVNGAWGQTDYSGVYFIGSRDYNANNTNTNYYLCPTEGWYYYNPNSPYYTDTPIDANDQMPFMTTYQCRNSENDYNEKNAVWVIEKAPEPNSGYYYIKRAIDGQYLTYNKAMENGSNKGRMRVHLQKTADGDNALFQITNIPDRDYFDIITKNAGPDNNNRKYMNITGAQGGYSGNQPSLQATNVRADGPKINGTAIDVGGTVGLWTSGSSGNNGDANSKWYLERTLLDAPTVNSVNPTTSKVTVNVNDVLPEGCTIRYTVSTNGSEPEDPTANGDIMPANGYYVEETCIIKVAVEYNGVLVTKVAKATLDPSFINVHVLTTNCDNTVTLSSNIHSAHIRYNITTDNTDPTSPTTSTGTLYDGYPLTLNVGDKLKAIAYTSTLTSEVSAVYTYAKVYTDAPTITYTSSAITITGEAGSTIYYTANGTDPEIEASGVTSGSSPIEIAYNGTDEVEIRAIAKSGTLEASCVTHLVTLTSPTVVMSNDNCNETSPQTNVLTITGPDDGRTFWYAITPSNNDAGHTASAAPDPTATPNPYRQYTLGTPVSINDIADGNTTHYTVHAYAMDAAGDRSSIVSSNWEMKTAGKPTLTEPVGSSPLLGISGGVEGDNAIVHWLDNKGTVETTDDISGSKTLTLDAHGDGQFNINSEEAVGTLTVTFQHGNWQPSCGVEYEIPGAPATPTYSQDAYNHLSLVCATDMAVIHYTYTTDGTDPAVPTIESETYTSGCLNNIAPGTKIRAIAVKGFRTSGVMNYTFQKEHADPPQFFVEGSKVVISVPGHNDAVIRYTYTTSGNNTDIPDAPDDATTTSTLYEAGEEGLTLTGITIFSAIAIYDGLQASYPVQALTREGYSINNGSELSKLATHTGSYFFIYSDITAPSNYSTVENFTGVIEGNGHTITGLTKPLINNANGAVIHDVILDNVQIDIETSSTNVGAFAQNATGDARIYNCGILGKIVETTDVQTNTITQTYSSEISGTNYVGGIVGNLSGNARVINCFSYANITGGDYRGGIVGYNSVETKSNQIATGGTMVMNCMFYGDINTENTPTQIAPIYCGEIITNVYTNGTNTGLNSYNYFRYNQPYISSITTYNCALGAQDRYLTRFEFYRLTLNSTRDLAAWYVTGDATAKNLIAKWVLDKNIAPYPILKDPGYYPSIINPDAEHAVAIDADNAHRNEGRKLGSLTVKIQMGNGAQFNHPDGASIRNTNAQGVATITRNITDKDTANFNFNYKKIQLPYYNEVGTGNYTKASTTDQTGRVVTGWKIVEINGSTEGTGDFSTTGSDVVFGEDGSISSTPFNYVDRTSTNKDLYSQSKRVFNQGAYWEVPDGVTSITIEPYWAKAAYLSDPTYDITYAVNGLSEKSVSAVGNRPTTNNHPRLGTQTINTTFGAALTELAAADADDTHSVYDYAVVLVGNYHKCFSTTSPTGANLKPVSVMSADFDDDCEPDYTFFYQHTMRVVVAPLRFDFINLPGVGMMQKPNGSVYNPEPGIFRPKHWFEITNTVLIHFNQFEYADTQNGGKAVMSPTILQGGIYEQFISARNSDAKNIQYLLIGGNTWFKNFANGCHTGGDLNTPKAPINVAGGDFENFYLSGIYRPQWGGNNDNAECYIDGGRFKEVAGAGMQIIKGSVTWVINGADIDEFYGGGINDAKPIQGNIYTKISNSYVRQFCGGPKFGNMQQNKTVTTIASNCHFGDFYGASYGGTSLYRLGCEDVTTHADAPNTTTTTWNNWATGTGTNGAHYSRGYETTHHSNVGTGSDETVNAISTGYDYEYTFFSGGANQSNNYKVARFYVDYASLSLARTHNVTSTLNNCFIVKDWADPDNDEIRSNGSVFGGGNRGFVDGDVETTINDCIIEGDVFGAGYKASAPTVDVMDKTGFLVAPQYNNDAGVFNDEQVKTAVSVQYTWKHAASVSTGNEFDETGGHFILTTANLDVLGTIDGNAKLTINGKTKVGGNVYGGGAESDVTNATEVTINGGTIGTVDEEGLHGGNVYGGGKGAADTYECEKAMVGTNGAGANENDPAYLLGNTSVTISNGTVNGNVYGGGEVGRVERNTTVTIGLEDGTGKPVIEGSVFGGGAGVKTHGYSALVRGNPTVIVQGNAWVKHSVYGGGEIASVARYQVPRTQEEVEAAIAAGYTDAVIDMPFTLANNTSGNCSVTIRGNAVIGPNDLAMPAFTGHVFGGGKGILPQYYPGTITDGTYTYENTNDDEHRPKRMVNVNNNNEWEWFATEPAYIQFIQTLALASKTDVTIGGNAFVKGSVYGGSENGIVQFNTHVTIEGDCQIGCGKNAEGKRHPSSVWADGYTPTEDLECNSWPFAEPHAPYDLYNYIDPTAENPVPKAASDGHTFYGNVFGGGSGYFPYKQDPEYEIKNLENNTKSKKDLGYADGVWLETAGIVRGNTVVDITGGHILTSVYGGNEQTDVVGTTTINMVGGTVGVPRSVSLMKAHPVTCYVFGAGKGDTRINFNTWTNVASTQVNITGNARIYGSTFGGGEDGHVIGDAETNIGGNVTIGTTNYTNQDVLIGTTGTSAVDGNVFGGGRGFSMLALTAGVIGGDVRVNIRGGKMLGTVFGGGRLASVGTYFADVYNANYGKMQADVITPAETYTAQEAANYNEEHGSDPDFEAVAEGDIKTPASVTASHGHIAVNIYDGTIGATNSDGSLVTSDYTVGDVFGGSKGTSDLRFGLSKTTTVNISGGTINGSVYGGGELANVEGNTDVTVSGGTIGVAKTKKGGDKIGNVYGGGKGNLTDPDAGLVKGNTKVTISETDATNKPTTIYHNIYGGGAYGSVGTITRDASGVTYVPGRTSNVLNMPTDWEREDENDDTKINTGTAEVYIYGGTIGRDGDENGMVFGSSRGDVAVPTGATTDAPLGTDVDPNDHMAWTYNTKVVIGGEGKNPTIKGSVYGSGENGHVFTNALVEIHNGTIGLHEGDSYDATRGNVYGGGCGEDKYEVGTGTNKKKYFNPLAGIVLGNTKVTMDGGIVKHNIYGAGALGSVGSGSSGGKTTIEISGGTVGHDGEDNGNVFGAARGTDTDQAYIAHVRETEVTILPNATPAKTATIKGSVFGGGQLGTVKENVNVNILGGNILHDVYGGGALADTQTSNWDNETYTAVTNPTRVTDLYTRTGNGTSQSPYVYTLTSHTTAANGTTYYRRGNWVSDNYHPATPTTPAYTTYKTHVNLLGGKISGDAYGGALGQLEYGTSGQAGYLKAIPAKVYGDVFVNLNGLDADDYVEAVHKDYVHKVNVDPTDDESRIDHYELKNINTAKGAIVSHVFGANNLNGTPMGHVKVHVFATQNANMGKIRDKFAIEEYDISNLTETAITALTDDDEITAIKNRLKDVLAEKITMATGLGVDESSVEVAQAAYEKDDYENDKAAITAYKNAITDLNSEIGNDEASISEVRYDVKAVYGGGNLSKYEPADPTPTEEGNETEEKTEVIIEGCDYTSIQQVYGGGNAAAAPATKVTVYECYEIDEVFGGGNGKDKYSLKEGNETKWYQNPGADVGYYKFASHAKTGNGDDIGSEAKPYVAKDDTRYDTKEERLAETSLHYGTGITETYIKGGRIHAVYGGSNTKGVIRTRAISRYNQDGDCTMSIDETYGAGKNASIDGVIDVEMQCAHGIEYVFGGAKNANLNSDINLKITNGSSLKRVFGGNNISGQVNGSITVTIEEGGCEPIHIEELYSGGYLAPYSIYGYAYAREHEGEENESINYGTYKTKADTDEDGNPVTQYVPREKAEFDALKAMLSDLEEQNEADLSQQDKNLLNLLRNELNGLPRQDPRINVISASRIDNIFGGGYKATVVGSPHVNVNMTRGKVDESFVTEHSNFTDEEGYKDPDTGVLLYKCVDDDGTLEIGTIGNIYGGGNMANIIGNTYVEIGTGKWISSWDASGNPVWETKDADNNTYTYKLKTPASYYTTDEECNQYNATLTGALNSSDELTAEQATAYNTAMSPSTNKEEGNTLSSEEANAYNATLDGAVRVGEEKTAAVWAWYNNEDNTDEGTTTAPTPTRNAARITGNVFGGGKGVADTFTCEKAMVGIDGAGADNVNYPNGYPDGNTNVTIGNGTIEGNVYGGGEIGRVEMNTTVTIGVDDDDNSMPIIQGDVFGAGQGVDTHGYSGLVRGNPTVIVQGKAKVRGNVYGGGEIASVARYKVKTDPTDPDAPTGWPMGMPYALKNANSGFCTVTIRDYAEIGPDDAMLMTADRGPDDAGHVFGAGKGILPSNYDYDSGVDGDNSYKIDEHKPKRMDNNSHWEYFTSEPAYIGFIQTLALASETNVTIGDHAFVKGSVYGGSMNGIVQYNTHVTIEDDCQIGVGFVQMNDDGEYLNTKLGVNRRYTDKEWEAGHLFVEGDPEFALTDGENPVIADEAERTLRSAVGSNNYTTSLPECASWPYESPYAPYDLYNLDANDKTKHATDGHTFYGNVFGGGSGYYPYRRKDVDKDGAAWAKDNDKTAELGRPVDANGYSDGVWLRSAGLVRGNTVVDIKGGHILTSVYGGNEQTDVEGSCTVNMSGGTLGVPRTLGQIAAHPVTCYLFGAGKGDQRINFNTWTNVESVSVNITGGTIYGSVFGGGEDGHVLGDVEMTIGENGDPWIGTWGTSYVDGNVFGGGRGFGGDAQTAGTVGGNINLTISGGTMLGSIYGGGRLASVGTQFTNPEDDNYGNFLEDNEDILYTQAECDAYNPTIPGYIPAYTPLTAAQATAYKAVISGGSKSEGDNLSVDEAQTYNSQLPGFKEENDVRIPAGSHGHVTINISGGTIGNDRESIEPDFNKENNIPVSITQTNIKKWTEDDWKTWKDHHNIPNTEFELYDSVKVGDTYTYKYHAKHTKGGNVFGGSMGRLNLLNGNTNPIWPKMAQVKTTAVNIYGEAVIKRSVYGGGELGTVRDNAYVTIGGIKKADVDENGVVNIEKQGGGTVNWDVFGGGYGSEDDDTRTIFSVKELKDGVTVPTGPEDYEPHSYAFTPMQFAGGVGKNTYVHICGGYVKKSVYGGGEMASAGIINCRVNDVNSEPGKDKIVVAHEDNSNTWTIYSHMIQHPENEVTKGFALSWPFEFEYVPTFEGATHVHVTGGRIGAKSNDDIGTDNGDIYGGGKGIAGFYKDYVFCANVGSTDVRIEYDDENDELTLDPKTYEDEGDCITGAVYGGGENGHVMGDTKLTLENGLIGHSIYGGGSGKGQYSKTLLKIGATEGSNNPDDYYTRDIYSITAGKVFGNTTVEMTGGYVIRNVYGGGNMGSVGKGNYAGGIDDYSYYVTSEKTYCGYGEALNGNTSEAEQKLWTSSYDSTQPISETNKPDNAWYFLNSGKCTVKILGGTIGYIDEDDPSNSMYPWNSTASLPYGNVFGGCRGESAPNITETPRYWYSPEFFVGYANETNVTIGTIGQSNEDAGDVGKAPRILGSVYGGGMDGHIRRDTYVTINSGEIGLTYTDDNIEKLGDLSFTDAETGEVKDNIQWLARGNVYGAGSGIGKYKYDFDYNNKIDDTVEGITYHGNPIKEEDYSTSAGSVTRFTTVNINGGIIHRNVYGGGSLSSVGAPKIPPTRTDSNYPYRKGATDSKGEGWQSLNQVNIASKIGTPENYNEVYGGEVYGASRGQLDVDLNKHATAVWTEVNLLPGAHVQGNVFGGGDNGMVQHDADVNVGVPTLTANPTTISFTPTVGDNDSKTINVTSNVKWSATSDADWLTVSNGTSDTYITGNGTLTITATANNGEGATERTATITISGSGKSQTITVKQAAPEPEPDPEP